MLYLFRFLSPVLAWTVFGACLAIIGITSAIEFKAAETAQGKIVFQTHTDKALGTLAAHPCWSGFTLNRITFYEPTGNDLVQIQKSYRSWLFNNVSIRHIQSHNADQPAVTVDESFIYGISFSSIVVIAIFIIALCFLVRVFRIQFINIFASFMAIFKRRRLHGFDLLANK